VADPLYVLPPLILHPFADTTASMDVLESAKEAAVKMLGGEPPADAAEALRGRLLVGRYAELRMLLFLGKDMFRWMGQCLDFAERDPRLRERGLAEQSFAEVLLGHTPPDVAAKLRRWGVTDYIRIFSRAIGIHVQFQDPPPREILGAEYLRQYHRYADYAYCCWKDTAQFLSPLPEEFSFSLYASGEYSKLLEEQWQR
jgi:hypothetical protein